MSGPHPQDGLNSILARPVCAAAPDQAMGSGPHPQDGLRPRPHEAETGETVTVSIYPVSQYLRKDEAKRNRVDL